MSYLSSKKIYPGNWVNALNGWYKNIDTDYSGSNDSTEGGPTSVLSIPGYRYFQQRGYVAVATASGWGDGRVASGIYAATGNVITFGIGLTSTGTVGEAVAQANLTSTTSGTQEGEIFFAGGTAGYSSQPFLTATGAAGVTVNNVYKQVTTASTYTVQARGSQTATTTSGGWYISAADKAAGRTGYFVVEVCYLQPDNAPGYEDIESYLINRTVSN